MWHLTFFLALICGISSDSFSGILFGISFDILSAILSGICLAYLLTFFLGFYWHLFRHSFWHSLWQSFWHVLGSRAIPQLPELTMWHRVPRPLHSLLSSRCAASCARDVAPGRPLAHSTAPQASSAHCDLELENLETLTWQVGRKKQKESAPILYPYASLVNPIILRQETRACAWISSRPGQKRPARASRNAGSRLGWMR